MTIADRIIFLIILAIQIICVYRFDQLYSVEQIPPQVCQQPPLIIYRYSSKTEDEEVLTESHTYESTTIEIIHDIVDDNISKFPNLSPELIKAMIFLESSNDPSKQNGEHYGLLQINPKWHHERIAKYGDDLFDPYTNIMTGMDYLQELYTIHGSIDMALMCYSGSHSYATELYGRGEVSYYVTRVKEVMLDY